MGMITGPQVLDPEHLADIINRLHDNIVGIEANLKTLERAVIRLQHQVNPTYPARNELED